jgi:type I pantothenate kinase
MTNHSPYLVFSREKWREFKRNTPLHLTEDDIKRLHGHYESVSLEEVVSIYLPLSRLLNLYVAAAQELFQVTAQFLGHPEPKVPYIIGVAGSVAVGKSTTSNVLQALLSQWEGHPHVEIVTTDGFLYPNAILEEKNLMHRKGFPESYNLRRLITFLSDLKAGKRELEVPIYSHQFYDITPEVRVINQPDIVIIEGLNLLQHRKTRLSSSNSQVFVTDYLDFSIYVDAATPVIEQWFLDRFLKLRQAAVNKPNLYLHRFTQMRDEDALALAKEFWTNINELNLVENILPFKERAKLILFKGIDHAVKEVHLRRI